MKKLIPFLILVAFVFCVTTSPATAAITGYFTNVRADVPTVSAFGGPVKWTADTTWFVLDQGFHQEICVLYLNPYGTQVSNGWFEFQGTRSQSGTMGNFCTATGEGVRICVDGFTQTTDRYGQTSVVTAAHTCN